MLLDSPGHIATEGFEVLRVLAKPRKEVVTGAMRGLQRPVDWVERVLVRCFGQKGRSLTERWAGDVVAAHPMSVVWDLKVGD